MAIPFSTTSLPLDRFFDLSSDICCVVDRRGLLLRVNPAWQRAIGGGGAGQLTELIHEADRAAVTEAIAGLFPGPAEASFECRAARSDGAPRWFSFRAITSPHEEVACCVGADITAAKASSIAPGFNERVYLQILDTVEDLVLVKGAKSRLLWANKAFCDLYGMTAEQLRGIIDAPFNEPDYTQQYIRDDAQVFESGEPLLIREEPVTRHDGVIRMLRTVKAPLRDERGEVFATVGVSSDITDRKRQWEEIIAMSTPILEIWDGVLAVPLIGIVDSARAANIVSTLLTAIVNTRSRIAIVDLTGVEGVDTSTAGYLLQLVRSVRLLGATAVLSGISPSVSTTMVNLGVEFGDLRTFGSLRAALRHAILELDQRTARRPGPGSTPT